MGVLYEPSDGPTPNRGINACVKNTQFYTKILHFKRQATSFVDAERKG